MRFSLPEEFKWSFGHLQIFEKEFLSDLKGYTAPYKIQTENEAFNQRFEIFAADEHNAFCSTPPSDNPLQNSGSLFLTMQSF